MRTRVGRCVLIMLTLMVWLSFSAMTVPAAKKKSKAKVKTKTFQVVASETFSYRVNEKTGNDKSVYTYNKQGVCTGYSNSEGRTTYKLDKNGYITEETTTSPGGALVYRTLYTRDGKGDPTQIIYYENVTGFTKPALTETYTYYKKGVVHTCNGVGYDGDTTSTTYDAYGNVTEEIMHSSGEDTKRTYTYVLDSHHNPVSIKEVTTEQSGDLDSSSTTTENITYQYNKAGEITQYTSRKVINYVYGVTETIDQTYTASYNKKGNITQETTHTIDRYGSNHLETSMTSTYKYKNVKVPKKFWHLYQ